MTTSQRLGKLVQSDIRRMTRECERIGGINLGQGICDLPTPLPVAEGAIQAIRDNRATYAPFEGIRPLREALAAELAREGLAADPDTELVITIGSTGALAAALVALLDPGDEIILFEPCYGYHRAQARILGIVPRLVPLELGSWRLDRERLAAAIGPRTRAIVVNTPANPSGKVFTSEELDVVAELCEKNDLFAITDEIYEKILYDGRKHLRLAARLRQRTITLSGYSKTYSITGWRLGWAFAPPDLARGIGLASDLLAVCAPTPLQWGVYEGLRQLPPGFYTDLAADYEHKRNRFVAALNEAGFKADRPEGAYYVLADISAFRFPTARAAADDLLQAGKVAAVAGSAFFDGTVGERYLRFCFAKDDAELIEAEKRIVEWGKARQG